MLRNGDNMRYMEGLIKLRVYLETHFTNVLDSNEGGEYIDTAILVMERYRTLLLDLKEYREEVGEKC